MADESLVTVVVPFIDWNPLVEACLAGCLAQDYRNLVVCLVPSADLVLPPEWRANPRVRVVPSGRDGISCKRNLGVAAVPEAAVYAFIDSDAVPAPDWLRRAVTALNREPSAWAVGGPDPSPPYAHWRQRAVAAALTSVLVSGPRVRAKRGGATRTVDDLKTCNMLVRAEAFRAAGGFDEAFAVGEDSAFCQEVRRRGGRLVFCADVVVWHQARRLVWPFAAQRITAGHGVPTLIARHARTMGAWAVGFRLLPALAVLFLATGWMAAMWHPVLGSLWIAAVAAYAALVGVESIRLAERPAEAPAIALALLIGNLGPGVGTLMRLLGVPLHIARFYRNDR